MQTFGPQNQNATNKKEVLIVDDHPIVRHGLKLLINQESDLVVCAEAESAPSALDAIKKFNPDIALVDLSIKGANGIELIKNIKSQYTLPILVVSIHDESLYAERALRAGAKGYIMKQEATENVLTAIRRVLKGEIYLSHNMGDRFLEKFINGQQDILSSPVARLSDRELEVFSLIGLGRGTRQIAEALKLSIKTVESHRAHIKQKLKLKNATELVHHAVQWSQTEMPT